MRNTLGKYSFGSSFPRAVLKADLCLDRLCGEWGVPRTVGRRRVCRRRVWAVRVRVVPGSGQCALAAPGARVRRGRRRCVCCCQSRSRCGWGSGQAHRITCSPGSAFLSAATWDLPTLVSIRRSRFRLVSLLSGVRLVTGVLDSHNRFSLVSLLRGARLVTFVKHGTVNKTVNSSIEKNA